MTNSETYTPGYTANASQFMTQRTAASHAAFLLLHLRPGLRVLDCGCGPGAITLDLAARVAPGEVTGLDREASQIALAREQTAARGQTNIQFTTGSLYELAFAEESFDVVFAHAVFEHLREPVQALTEIRRVLRPGGIVALRSPDWGGFLLHPQAPELEAAIQYYRRLQTENGGDVLVGRKFKTLLLAAGFVAPEFTATYECYRSLPFIGEYLAQRIERSPVTDQAVERGWATAEEITAHTAALRHWMQSPDGVFAQTWCEIIGCRP